MRDGEATRLRFDVWPLTFLCLNITKCDMEHCPQTCSGTDIKCDKAEVSVSTYYFL